MSLESRGSTSDRADRCSMSSSSRSQNEFLIRALVASGDRDYVRVSAYLRTSGFPLPEMGEAARTWCEEQANLGDAEAQFVLAKLATVGLFGPEDKHAGRIWCEKAVDQGHLPALLL